MLRQLFSDPEAPPFAARRPSSSSSTGTTTRSSSTGRGDGDRPEPVPSFDLGPSAVVEAHNLATQATEAFRRGELDEAVRAHLAASHHFLEAAERLQDNEVTASALLLLADGHARQAYTLQLKQQREKGEGGAEGRPGIGGAASVKKGVQAGRGGKPEGPASGHTPMTSVLPEGSMYSSAMGPDRHGTTQVDDMLALERQLHALGVQPLHASGTYGAMAGNNPYGRYLSSTLGESFFVVSNRNAAARDGGMTEGGMSASALRGSKVVSKRPLPGQGEEYTRRDRSGLPPDGRRDSQTGGAKPSGGAMGQASSGVRGSSTGEGSKEDGQEGAGAHQMYHRRMAGGEGSFLDSVTPVQEKEVMRLLEAMQTLGEENRVLLKQVEESARVRQENEKLKRDMTEFKTLYQEKFKKLRTALEEFRQQFAHDKNPANHLITLADKARIESLEAENQRLQACLKTQEDLHRKKDVKIKRYEQWYRTLCANAQSKQRMSAQQAGAPGTGVSGTAGSSRGLQPTQQLRMQHAHQQQASLRGPASSSPTSGRPPTLSTTGTGGAGAGGTGLQRTPSGGEGGRS